VSAHVDLYRDRFGVEPICETLGVSASAYYQRATGAVSARVVEDARLLGVIRDTHKKNYEAYGFRRMWKALLRAGERVPRCRVQGFRVADGDTRWYRIGSSPWSGAYYASADAFYNNGQTSGSLVGTPFVDPNVAGC
jgi:hypothetical protein